MDRFCTATDGFAVPTRAARNRQATPRFKRQIPSPRSAVESNRAATPCGPAGPAGAKRLDRMNVRGHQLSTRSPWLRRPLQRNGSHNPTMSQSAGWSRYVSRCLAPFRNGIKSMPIITVQRTLPQQIEIVVFRSFPSDRAEADRCPPSFTACRQSAASVVSAAKSTCPSAATQGHRPAGRTSRPTPPANDLHPSRSGYSGIRCRASC
jgi:hypothetical protein